MDLEPTGTAGRDETKEKRAMANIRMMTATALAALLAMGAAPAAMRRLSWTPWRAAR